MKHLVKLRGVIKYKITISPFDRMYSSWPSPILSPPSPVFCHLLLLFLRSLYLGSFISFSLSPSHILPNLTRLNWFYSSVSSFQLTFILFIYFFTWPQDDANGDFDDARWPDILKLVCNFSLAWWQCPWWLWWNIDDFYIIKIYI